MKKFVVSSDSTCDFYAGYIRERDVKVIAFPFVMELGGAVSEESDAFTEYAQYVDFYERERKGGLPRTSQINFERHYEYFSGLVKEGASSILHVSLSGGLSPTVNVAREAAAAVVKEHAGTEILVVDSLSATIGQGELVKEALHLRDEGGTAQEAYDRLNEMTRHIQHTIIAYDLNFLCRGGRVSRAAAIAGTMLSIKPVLTFTEDGKLTVIDKCRGMKGAFRYAVERINRAPRREGADWFHIVHTDAPKEAEQLADLLEQTFGVRAEISIMGPVIGAHVGPGSVSVVWESEGERIR